MKVAHIQITGMSCNHCVMHVLNSLHAVNGVKGAKLTLEEKNAIVEYDETKTDMEHLIAAIEDAGYKGEVMHHAN